MIRLPLIKTRTEQEAFTAGYSRAKRGPNMTNCHFTLFATKELLKAWEAGRRAYHNRKRHTRKVIAVIVFLLFLPSAGFAETIWSGLTPVSITQIGSTCHSAAASEILWATDWAMQPSPSEVYKEFTTTFGYGAGSIEWDVSWYLGKYYPEVNHHNVEFYGYGIDGIKADIDKGYGTVAIVSNGSSLHDLAVWGYDINNGVVTGLWYTNSWGNSSLFLDNNLSDGFFYNLPNNITGVVSLMDYEDYVPPDPVDPPTLPPPPSDSPPSRVAEPTVIILVGWGLAGIGFMRRREWYDCAA